MSKQSIQMILSLLIISFFAALTISFTYEHTRDTITARTNEAMTTSLRSVLSRGSTTISDTLYGFGQYWTEIDASGNVIGFAFISETVGYSSLIRFVCGIGLDGRIKGLSVINHAETPGIGARIVESISDLRFPLGLFTPAQNVQPWFSQQFVGISANENIYINRQIGEWHRLSADERSLLLGNNQITSITGATVTTAAIKREVSARARSLIYLINQRYTQYLESENFQHQEESMEGE